MEREQKKKCSPCSPARNAELYSIHLGMEVFGFVQEGIEKKPHMLIINRIITKTGVYCFFSKMQCNRPQSIVKQSLFQ
ncbi:MAG: hypothetical protein A2007_00040 [Verrucomicrobia bacterium GWC2_42_7]|nr:MAG: hypothetical protein A2007_00040 [Verrucomicrobia bacterium GWC2_42_7]